MASSLEVVRQRITSPVRYPLPPSAHKRFNSSGIVGAPQFGNHSRMVPIGFVGRHSWSAVSQQTSSLLANRVQRLNLRFSPPTPGEEELCRSWMQNSAKLSKCNNEEKTNTIAQKPNWKDKLERPKTAHSPGHQYQDLMGRRAAQPKSNGRVRSPVREHMTSSDSERLGSPSASHRSSPPHVGNQSLNATRKMRKIPEERHIPQATFGRAETSRYSPNSIENTNDINRTSIRPHSARPHEARRRSRAKASNTPPNIKSGITGNSRQRLDADTRRWSLSEAVMNHHDTKDDDSAYSSSRDITIHTDRAQTNSPGPPRSPPRSAPNVHSTDETHHPIPNGRLSRARIQCPRVMMSGQDGRPVIYYRHNHNISSDDSQISRHNTRDVSFVPLRRPPGRTLQRPVTQPAMETKHSRRNYSKRMSDAQQLREDMEEKLRSRALSRNIPVQSETNKISSPGWKNSSSNCDVTTRQWTSVTIDQRTMKSISQYVEPELLKRILDWLTKIEPNPKLYYGFETDIFGDTIRTSE